MSSTNTDTSKYLVITTGNEIFAIPLLRVQEVIRIPTLRNIPNVPADILGVITRRERVIPVVELAKLLGFEAIQTLRPALVVCRHNETLVGLRVESVDRVDSYAPSEIKPIPNFSENSRWKKQVAGMVERDGKTALLLDLDSSLANIIMPPAIVEVA